MPNWTYARAVAALTGALALAACSSSGGGGPAPSQQKIVAKLKSDPAVKSQLGPLVHNDPAILNTLYACIATAMRNDAEPADVSAYVAGRKSLDSVAQAKSAAKLQTDLTACATKTVPLTPVAPTGVPSS